MKAWFTAPVTRAEAIGFALGVPALFVILRTGMTVSALLDLQHFAASQHAELVSPTLQLFLDVGPAGWSVLFGLCALVTLLALVLKQPPWVRIAAPLICGALALSVQVQYASELRDYARAVEVTYGDPEHAARMKLLQELDGDQPPPEDAPAEERDRVAQPEPAGPPEQVPAPGTAPVVPR